MPLFDYWCVDCKQSQERNVKIDERENQYCDCDNHLTRQISFNGAVFSETSNGGMKV